MNRAQQLIKQIAELKNDERSSDHQKLVDYYLPRVGESYATLLYRNFGISRDPNRPIVIRRTTPDKEKGSQFSMWIIIPIIIIDGTSSKLLPKSSSDWRKLGKILRGNKFDIFQELTSETNFHTTYEIPWFSKDSFILEIGLRETKPQKFVSRYLYHQTSAPAAKKIEKEGLLPNKSFYHSDIPSRSTDRIFFTQKPQKKEDKFLGRKGAVQYRVDRKKHLKGITFWGHRRGGEILIDRPVPAHALERVAFEEFSGEKKYYVNDKKRTTTL